jgi:hypothetical protein
VLVPLNLGVRDLRVEPGVEPVWREILPPLRFTGSSPRLRSGEERSALWSE